MSNADIVREALERIIPPNEPDCDCGPCTDARAGLAALAALEAEVSRLREALGEMHALIQTRRTSLYMDGTEMFAQPVLAQLNSIATRALEETT